jgi:hypothetical protein
MEKLLKKYEELTGNKIVVGHEFGMRSVERVETADGYELFIVLQSDGTLKHFEFEQDLFYDEYGLSSHVETMINDFESFCIDEDVAELIDFESILEDVINEIDGHEYE